MTEAKTKLTDVFKTQGKPNHTYVSTSDGHYEKKLRAAIENRGTLCLITGPSKTGKTTLVSKAAEQLGIELVTIRCDDKLDSEEFWRRGLEAVDFERLSQRKNGGKTTATIGGKVAGTFGWKWLAGVTGESSAGFVKERSEEEIRDRILSKPSPSHLVPILRDLAALLVIEDFHYLRDEIKTTIFQQWKTFVDQEVSVVVIGTTHHACDLAYANKDLIGRITHLELTTWLTKDLREIIDKGCAALRVTLPDSIKIYISEESVGLPIVTQAIALELLERRNITVASENFVDIDITKSAVFDILHEVARSKYSQFEMFYTRMAAGLRKGRRYQTYECMLSAFSLDHVTYKLKRSELRDRITKLPLPASVLPPEGSVKQSLRLLSQLQKKIGVELLEWVEKDDVLYIIEPTFLFYLRWRKRRSAAPDVLSAIKDLLIGIEVDENGKARVVRVRVRRKEDDSAGRETPNIEERRP